MAAQDNSSNSTSSSSEVPGDNLWCWRKIHTLSKEIDVVSDVAERKNSSVDSALLVKQNAQRIVQLATDIVELEQAKASSTSTSAKTDNPTSPPPDAPSSTKNEQHSS